MKKDALVKTDRQLGEMDRLIYEIGLVALGIVIAAVLLYCITGFSVLDLSYPCFFNRITHLPCPGCGGTRALRALIVGDFVKSIYYYMPLSYVIVVYVIFMVRCVLHKYFGVRKSTDGTIVKYIYLFIALMLLQWIVKLVAQLAFGYVW